MAASSGTSRPVSSSSPTRTSSATASTRPDPQSPRGSTSPMTPSVTGGSSPSAWASSLMTSIGSVGRAHAAADRATLEGRSRRGRGGQDGLAVAQHDLAVGADVDEEPGALVAVHAGGQHPGDDVAADVGPERGEEVGASTRVERQTDLGGEHRRWLRGRHDEGRHARAARGRCRGPGRSWWRCRRSRPRRPGRGRSRPRGRPAPRGRTGSAPARAWRRPRASPSIMVALMRVITSPPKGCCVLSIEVDRERGAGADVEQGADHGRGAEVEGDGVARRRGVAWLDVDRGPRR